MLIARLIADKGLQETGEFNTRLDKLRDDLVARGMPLGSLSHLASDEAVIEMHFSTEGSEGDPSTVLAAIDAHLGAIDALVSASPIAIPRLFVSDMDSTMIGQECIDELADYAGLKDRIADITERAMQGELDFRDALRERVSLLKGLDENAIDSCLADRITPTPGARTLVQTLKAHGARSVLVTGGFHHFADRVADTLGFDRTVGNRLAVEEGKLTGKLEGAISDADTKKRVLLEEADLLEEGAHILASGDGANDIPMLRAATYGFAYRAKPKARAAANGRVDSEDLTAVLRLLGIPTENWVMG